MDAETLARFEVKYKVDPETGCWIWQAASIPQRGSKAGNRYGMFHWNGKMGYAHRFAYEVWRGPVPARLTIDHRCKTTLCCCPFHLEAVSLRTNVQRGDLQVHPIVVKAANRECTNGHWLDEENTYNDSRGHSRCRMCARELAQRYRLRQAVPA